MVKDAISRAGMVLISDLDGTLLGSDAAIERFRRWFDAEQSTFLVYATGCTTEATRLTLRTARLPEPNAAITAVGTEVWWGAIADRDVGWPEQVSLEHWSVPKAQAALEGCGELLLQEPDKQTDLKLSYYGCGLSNRTLRAIKGRLREAGLDAQVIDDGLGHVDILPRGVDKGAAVAHVLKHLKMSARAVIVCGDSGNDLPMLRLPFCAVVVGNARQNLLSGQLGSAYRARATYADGVLEGVAYWRRQMFLCRRGKDV